MRQMMQIPLCALVLALNLRLNPGDQEELRRLGASYLKRPIHPIICRTDKTVLDGNRRVLGMRLELGEESDHPVDCVLTDEELRPEDILEIGLVTAMHRQALSDPEIYLGSKKLRAAHPEWQKKDLAAALDLHASMATMILAVDNLIPAAREQFLSGAFGFSIAYQISKVSEREQHELLAARSSGASRDEMRRQARRTCNSNGNGQAVRVGKIKCPLPSGMTVQISGDGIDLDQAIEAAQDWVKEAKRASDQGLDAKTFERVCRDKSKKG
jgi:hypothetical protein